MRNLLSVFLLVPAACGSADLQGQDLADLPPITGEKLAATIAASTSPQW